MRVLVVTPLLPPEPGGPSYYAEGLADALEQAGDTVEVLAFREVRQYPSGVRHVLFLYKTLLRALHADTLIILDTVSVALPAVIAGWVLGKQLLVRVGGDFVWESYVERTGDKVPLSEFYSMPRALSRKEQLLVWLQKQVVLRFATKVVFSTAWQRDIWVQAYGVSAARTAVVANSIPAVAHTPTSDTARTDVLWVGRALTLKNVSTLDDAFADIRTTYPEMQLVKLTNVPREQVEEAFTTARCLVVPSVSEVSPNIVYEALAHGVPVVCTADTGIREGLDGVVRFVDTLDKDALAKALSEMCDMDTYGRYRNAVAAFVRTREYDVIAQEFKALCS